MEREGLASEGEEEAKRESIVGKEKENGKEWRNRVEEREWELKTAKMM